MYRFILDDITLPVAPAKMAVKTGNKNKTVDLVSIGEVNILKNTGLREFSFEAFIPGFQYPFVDVKEGFYEPSFYIEKFKKLKDHKKPFSFEMLRVMPSGSEVLGELLEVSLEEYSVRESAGEEGDFWISVSLKEYRLPQIKTITPLSQENNGTVLATETTEREAKETASTYTVQPGDSLWAISRRELNSGERFKEIAELNGIKDPNKIYPGQILKLPAINYTNSQSM